MADDDERRKNLRYNPDKNSLLLIAPNDANTNDELIGLLRDISSGGCAGIFHQDYFEFPVGETVWIQTESLERVEGSIIWEKSVDKMFLKVGFEFKNTVDL